tara:strand:+ start:1023 stop:1712 length:690 start_codon:yes stop_codon:yes gene_type:complete
MKAIAITQELKDLNPSIFKQNVGVIKTLKEIPKSFYSLTYINGRLTDGYHKLDNSVHEADGFYDLIEPDFNKETQRLGGIYFNVYDVETPELVMVTVSEFTYTLLEKTEAEVVDYLENKEDSEAKSQIDKHNLRGLNLFGKCERKIWRRRFKDSDANNKLTQGEVRDLKKWFAPVYQWLILGNFQQAKQEISKVITNNQAELDLVQGMIGTATWFQTEILDYFDNKYDL